MSFPPRRAWLDWVRFAVLAGAVVAAYWPALEAPFIFDDNPAIVRNPSIRHLAAVSTIFNPPGTAAGAAARPVVNATLAVDYAWHGLSPRGFHATNIALHALTAWLLFLVARRVFAVHRTRALSAIPPESVPNAAQDDQVAFAMALLWAIHPLLTESVACVIQRNEILVAASILATLYALLRANVGTSGRTWLVIGVVSTWMGAASKEVAAVTPFLALAFDSVFLSAGAAAAWQRRKWFYAGLAGSWLLTAVLVLHSRDRAGTAGFGLGTSSWQYLITQCRAVAIYAKLAIWPHPLVLDYGFDLVPGLRAVWSQALAIMAALIVSAVGLRRRRPWGFLGAAFFLLLAPSSSVIPLTTQTIAEHRMYLPLAAIVTLGVLGARAVVGARVVLAVAAGLALMSIASRHIETYRSEESLWRETVANAPRNARAWSSLANVLVREGKWADAAPLYAKAVALRPDYADTQNDFANVLMHLSRTAEALEHYAESARLKPADPDIQLNYAGALLATGDVAGASTLARTVLESDPRNVRALNMAGDAALKANDPAAAYSAFSAALAIAPDSGMNHNNVAVALLNLGRYTEAVAHYRAALRDLPDSALVHHNLALALDGAGDLAAAIREEQRALALEPHLERAHAHLTELQQRQGPGP